MKQETFEEYDHSQKDTVFNNVNQTNINTERNPTAVGGLTRGFGLFFEKWCMGS